jgi:hypothetical protein
VLDLCDLFLARQHDSVAEVLAKRQQEFNLIIPFSAPAQLLPSYISGESVALR